MKEIIESVVFAVALLGAGSVAMRQLHDTVRKAALTKATHGLPSLTKLTKTLTESKLDQSTLTPNGRKEKKEYF